MPGYDHEDFRRITSPFEGALVRLRAMEEDDLPRVNELFWDPDVTAGVGAGWPEPLAGTRAFWESTRANPNSELFAIETLDGELVGGCSLFDIDARNRSAVLGIWVGKPYWDHGYGTDAVRTLCRFGFREMNFRRVSLGVYGSNPRAVRAYEKVGFKVEGRRRRAQFVRGGYVDAIDMGLLPGDLLEA
jgi:RimJ/RimL family protein N-acetyltransferase